MSGPDRPGALVELPSTARLAASVRDEQGGLRPGASIASDADWYIHHVLPWPAPGDEGCITIVDDDHIEWSWVAYKDGKPVVGHKVALKLARKK